MCVSSYAIAEFKAIPDRADELVARLSEVLPESLEHDGCEALSIRRNSDDPSNVIVIAQWRTRSKHEEYLAWRGETGQTDDFDRLLVEPIVIRYFDEVESGTR
jgi:quinol monooxygenase YgiN